MVATLATPLLRGLLPTGVLNVNDANFVLRRGLAEGRQTNEVDEESDGSWGRSFIERKSTLTSI